MACIGIDCRFAALPVGLGTYTRGLISQVVSQLSGHHIVLIVRSANEDWLSHLPDHVQVVEFSGEHYSLSEQVLLPRLLRQLAVDLWYAPHFNVPLLANVPFVSTVHDLTLHHYPNNASFLKRMAYRMVMRHAVLRARQVIAVSQYTASDVHRAYGRQPTVVTEGVEPMFVRQTPEASADVLRRYDLPPKFFLYVGGNKQHKNVQLLIDAHAKAATQAALVLVTSPDATRSLRYHDEVTILTDVPTAVLPHLYSQATCFVTASLYEGFCLPVLEARACGCPVIATDLTAIPEVAGPHTKLITPTIGDLMAALRSPPTTADLPPDSFDWKAAASDVCAILTAAIDG